MQKLIQSFEKEGVVFKAVTETVHHLGQSREIEVLKLDIPESKGSGRLPAAWSTAGNQIIPFYREEMIKSAKNAIEAEIEAQRQAERQRQEEAEKARQEAAKEAEEEKAALIAEIEALKKEPKNRFSKATKGIAYSGMGFLFILLSVAFAMNGHNLAVLYDGIISKIYLYGFALALAYTPIIFAWVGDNQKVKMALWILPVDFIVTVVLFIFLSDNSPLVQNWGLLQKTRHFWHLAFSVVGVAFYSFQVFLIAKLLLQSIEKKDALFMSIFK